MDSFQEVRRTETCSGGPLNPAPCNSTPTSLAHFAAALVVALTLVLPAGFAPAANAAVAAESGAAALAAAAAAPAAAPDPQALVRRTTFIVHDLDAAVKFYRDVLGFEVWLENQGKITASSLPVNLPLGASSRLTIMKGRHPWVGMVGLLQYGEARKPPKPARFVAPGDAVLMIETLDVMAIYERMRQAGTRILRSPQTSEVTGAGGARWSATFLFAYDPDGHLLEINQRQPLLASTLAPAVPAAASATANAPGAVRIRRAFADVRSGQLHYRRAEPAHAVGLHAPVVMLHMTPLSGRMFSEFLPQLASDRVVYALDTPGYGESDAPPQPPSVGDYVDALHDFIGNLKEPVDLLGYHTGALLAAEYAVRYPAEVRRLVLVSYPLFSEQERLALRGQSALAEDGSALLAEWRSTMAVRPAGQSLEQAARIVAEKQRAGTRAAWATGAMREYEAAPRLRLITRPTSLLRPKDSLWSGNAAAAALVPGARQIDLPQWGYGLFDAAPAELAGIVRDELDRTVP